MSAFAVFFILTLGLILGSGDKATTVILLPDEEGKVGSLSVRTEGGEQTLDQAYHAVSAESMDAPPSPAQEMGMARVNEEFRELLQAQPAKPVSFLLYFVSGSTELTEESRATIPQVLDAIRGRGPTMISIIGHADRTGSTEINARVSLERASAIEKMLKEAIPGLDRVELQFFGDKELLVPTPPNTPEARNRRVEIMIL